MKLEHPIYEWFYKAVHTEHPEFDMDEWRTAAEHGCSAGVLGFCYTEHVLQFYYKHSALVEGVVRCGAFDSDYINISQLLGGPAVVWSLTEIITRMVWLAVDIVATAVVELLTRKERI